MKLDTFRSKLMSWSPIAYWRLNDESYAKAADATGLGYDGAWSSPTIALAQTLAAGVYGASFPGNDSAYLSLPNISSFRIPILSGLLTIKDGGTAVGGRILSFTGGLTTS